MAALVTSAVTKVSVDLLVASAALVVSVDMLLAVFAGSGA
jgi:hypothetical protein